MVPHLALNGVAIGLEQVSFSEVLGRFAFFTADPATPANLPNRTIQPFKVSR
ncbi:hypothetical protein [Sneathiella glossodoripedis]|uniref:hypothetical protein n=1 Tax=Sneathiella glossodoripedis TaxID=418853 RepID=UPI00131EEC1D|nr:hypothetical protein [Sneathiella glossodoripedis]